MQKSAGLDNQREATQMMKTDQVADLPPHEYLTDLSLLCCVDHRRPEGHICWEQRISYFCASDDADALCEYCRRTGSL